ncbi:MAG: PhoU domain-containing protein, partial [Nitrososphaerota archaeon]
ARSIIERDDEVDRFYHFIVRQLNIALSNYNVLNTIEPPTKQSCLGYMLASKSIERSADHAVLIAKSIIANEKSQIRVPKKVIDFGVTANVIFEDSLKSMLVLDHVLANQVLTKVFKVLSETEQAELHTAKNINLDTEHDDTPAIQRQNQIYQVRTIVKLIQGISLPDGHIK